MSVAGVREIKARIEGVKNISQITKAMKMVAAAKIKKAEKKAKEFTPYANELKEMVNSLLNITSDYKNPLFLQRDTKKIGVLVITSKKGLCGSYNSNIINTTEKFLKRLQKDYLLYIIGNKGYFHFREKTKVEKFLNITDNPDYIEAYNIAEFLIKDFKEGKIDELYAIYTAYFSPIKHEVNIAKILPIKELKIQSAKENLYSKFLNPEKDLTLKSNIKDFLFEPSVKEVLDSLIDQFFTIWIYYMLIESIASELGSRLIAMSNATDNANELIKELTLQYYKARQEMITKEILEISSGAESLRAKR